MDKGPQSSESGHGILRHRLHLRPGEDLEHLLINKTDGTKNSGSGESWRERCRRSYQLINTSELADVDVGLGDGGALSVRTP